MTFDEFHNGLEELAAKMASEVNDNIAKDVESAALRFVDNNFARQGWEGMPWKPSTGTILVKSGDLRSGFRSEVNQNQVRIYNEIPYAPIHNQGFSGNVNIRKHTRRNYKGGRGKLKAGKLIDVSAHTRHMRMPQRQFAPYPGHESPTLNTEVITIIDEHIIDLLNDLKK